MIIEECSIACGKCGQSAELFSFCQSRLGGIDLPKDEYQCPNCGYHWKIEPVGEAYVAASGRLVLPERKLRTLNELL